LRGRTGKEILITIASFENASLKSKGQHEENFVIKRKLVLAASSRDNVTRKAKERYRPDKRRPRKKKRL